MNWSKYAEKKGKTADLVKKEREWWSLALLYYFKAFFYDFRNMKIKIFPAPILLYKQERLSESHGIRPWGRSTFPGAGAPGRAAQNDQLAWSEHFS